MKIFVAGHKGLVGNSILKRLYQSRKKYEIITKDRSELELTDYAQVFDFFYKEKPDWVFLAAAKVGGICANMTYPVEFLLDNLRIQNNVIEASFRHDVAKLMFFGSSCIYPRQCPQPIKEEYLLSSELEPTNEFYAIAKISGIKLCKAYNREYGANFISVMPTNLYGINDNYHPQNAHVIPMLIRRFHEAKENKLKEVLVWGTGKPMREFLFADDLADACIFLMENYSVAEMGELINIGTGEDCTILALAELIKEIVGYQGKIVLDATKPDGTPRKLLDVSKINSMGWKASTLLKDGLAVTYRDFLINPLLRK